MVMLGQQGQHESTDGMLAEIGRYISDPQAALGSAVVAVGLEELPQGLGMLLVPAVLFPGDGPRIEAGMVVQGTEPDCCGLRGRWA